ncbi:maleylpyruvate isomerase family mycothiol-dependent enzyme [Saccharothrix obliqua]|uniref:maleylpyruvate isomerase family mycothiol-dependent enzyme n=1 Tax=Saccharothrix obliqua TaxID=2861747 RepID=UPI001C6053DE|nr:maleylpyruvate isomerase family mycothiol-dependent enzyme [Saccharothrix obliqua]MBW4719836.1 maleylpyruvate isomerase family mycothiol-dependent enzyme [Saccharothrix obliqua]
MSNAVTYDAARRRIIGLVIAGDPGAAVDACPGWTVKDVVAHLAGGLGDFANRNLDGVDTGEWGERQVRDRRSRTLGEVFAEWERNFQVAEGLFDSPAGAVLIAEVVEHEHDIRTALGRPGDRRGVSVRAALTRPLQEVDQRLRARQLPALRVVLEHGDRILGEGEPTATLRTSAFELLRVVGGRRSESQIRSLDWDADPTRWLAALQLFGTRDTALVE